MGNFLYLFFLIFIFIFTENELGPTSNISDILPSGAMFSILLYSFRCAPCIVREISTFKKIKL